MSFEVSPECKAFRAVIDTALEQVTENALKLAGEKGLDIEASANILSAGLLYHSFQLLLALAEGDVKVAAETQVSGLNMLVAHISSAAGRAN